MIHMRGQQWDEAEQALAEAAALARTMPYPHEQGRLERTQGRSEQGAHRIEEAIAIFRRLGAQPDLRTAEDALKER
jgi:hypothetical protein